MTFGVNIQKIEFTCFSFHVGLLFCQLFVFESVNSISSSFGDIGSKRIGGLTFRGHVTILHRVREKTAPLNKML